MLFLFFLLKFLELTVQQCSPSAKGLNQTLRDEILVAHNNFRVKVANATFNTTYSTASNIVEMVWESELEEKAQLFVETCPDNLNFRNRSSRSYQLVGENMLITKGKVLNATQVVESWFNSFSLFRPSYVSPFRFNYFYTGFTQVSWASTSKVGCGFALYKIGFDDSLTLVCNYVDPGNKVGEALYLTGTQ